MLRHLRGQEAAMAKVGLVIFHALPLEVVLGDWDEAIPLRSALCSTSDRGQAAVKAVAVGSLPFLLYWASPECHGWPVILCC